MKKNPTELDLELADQCGKAFTKRYELNSVNWETHQQIADRLNIDAHKIPDYLALAVSTGIIKVGLCSTICG